MYPTIKTKCALSGVATTGAHRRSVGFRLDGVPGFHTEYRQDDGFFAGHPSGVPAFLRESLRNAVLRRLGGYIVSGDDTERVRLTEKDRQLLVLLQKNAREPTASLARKLGVSRTTVQERIQRLEASNVINGYSVRINEGKLANTVKCFCFAACDNKSYTAIIRQLKEIDAVRAVHSISGEWDIVMQLSIANLEELNKVVNAINGIPGVNRTATHIIMETKYDRQF